MRIGYACLTRGIPYTDIKGTVQKNATEARLRELIAHNLASLDRMLDYNRDFGIHMLRISSDIIPFGSSPVNTLRWNKEFEEELAALGRKITAYDIRVSMHPGQYTVLNSPRAEVVDRAILDLEYHVRFLEALGTDTTNKIILHVGGVYGDKRSAMDVFSENWDKLQDSIKSRLVIENDDKSYTIEDVLELGIKNGIPVVFDNLHHQVNGNGGSDLSWITEASKTWKKKDGVQKIHYSQQDGNKSPGAHSGTIDIAEFLKYIEVTYGLDFDIMLEVKDKNLSAIKVINALYTQNIVRLEKEWSRYKYNVLENSPSIYQEIRELLKDKSSYPVVDFYKLLDQALETAPTLGTSVNTLEHVWGYFKDIADDRERTWYVRTIDSASNDSLSLSAAKKKLWSLVEKYGDEYLKNSYYFHL